MADSYEALHNLYIRYCIAGIFRGQYISLFSWISQLPQKLIFKNLIIVYNCNDNLVDPRNLIREWFNGLREVNIENFCPQNFPAIR